MSWTTLVGASAIVTRGNDVLMVRQRRHYGTHWELPSGYYEPGESLEETAAREVLEETAVPIEVGSLLCTLVWERESDRRRNVLAFFLGHPRDPEAEPRPQTDEDIDAAAFVDIAVQEGMHPLELPVLERWRAGETAFHLHAEVSVDGDGRQSYAFRS